MNNLSYKHMRLLVMFDMPVETKKQRKEYAKFRKALINNGFMMLQYSVYTRYCNNDTDTEKFIKRVMSFKPKYGNVRMIKITENQFEKMILVVGERDEQELNETREQLVVI